MLARRVSGCQHIACIIIGKCGYEVGWSSIYPLSECSYVTTSACHCCVLRRASRSGHGRLVILKDLPCFLNPSSVKDCNSVRQSDDCCTQAGICSDCLTEQSPVWTCTKVIFVNFCRH